MVKSAILREKERMEITLPILVDYHATAKQVKGCSKKTIVGTRSNLGKFIRFLESQGLSSSPILRFRMLVTMSPIYRGR